MRALTDWSIGHRKRMVGLWIVLLVVVGGIAGSAGSDYQNVFKLPGTESQRAYDLLAERFPEQSGDSMQAVFAVAKGSLAEQRRTIESALESARGGDEIATISSPFARGAGAVSKDGRIGFGNIGFDKPADQLELASIEAAIKKVESARGDGLRVEFGGPPALYVSQQEQEGGGEVFGVLAAAIVLIITFGSLVTAGMPLLTALLSLGTGLSLVGLLSQVMNVADFAPQLAAMIGLGVGIDYALFIVTRYREEVRGGRSYEDAARTAMATAGRAVLFAGVTVIIALLGMMLIGISFLYGLALASSIAVLLTMLAALTLLPALLVMAGGRINRLRFPGTGRHPERQGRLWRRWSDAIAQRPAPYALVGLLLLLLLSAPALGMRLGSSDSGNDPEDRTTRQAYDLLAEGFGPGFNGPLVMTVELPGDPAGAREALTAIPAALRADPDLAAVTPAQPNEAGDTAVLTAYATTAPQDENTTALIERLRENAIPPVERSTDTRVSVGGFTASIIDFTDVVASKLPLFIGMVIGLSLLLLMVAFRSILVPIKAALMNVLSIGASFGVVVAVFQNGWGAELIGVDSTGPIESFLPVMVFAIVFGLSMDYEVFLMSRVHEEWEKTRDAKLATTRGLAETGRVITAAAMIMVLVFSSFILLDDRVIKLFGLGLASAVFIDAFVIRSLLVPAVMHLLDKRAWWLPSWLDRRLPRVSIEAPQAEPEPARI